MQQTFQVSVKSLQSVNTANTDACTHTNTGKHTRTHTHTPINTQTYTLTNTRYLSIPDLLSRLRDYSPKFHEEQNKSPFRPLKKYFCLCESDKSWRQERKHFSYQENSLYCFLFLFFLARQALKSFFSPPACIHTRKSQIFERLWLYLCINLHKLPANTH